MEFLKLLFRRLINPAEKSTSHNKKYTASSFETPGFIKEKSRRLAEIINESLKIAVESDNPETKVSRLSLARNKFNDLEKLDHDYPELGTTGLNEVASLLSKLEFEFLKEQVGFAAEGNSKGKILESKGLIDEALKVYEELALNKVDTPGTYRRLAILYRKRKDKNSEIKFINLALKNIPKSNAQHYQWFEERLEKLCKS